ncbi:PBP1A family penicillin-binding protein [Candidatus Falkowbacteria bacterium]|nr:PBP1A family penicillin-binding protein [Candidatus Falkowbacteria bacterium]
MFGAIKKIFRLALLLSSMIALTIFISGAAVLYFLFNTLPDPTREVMFSAPQSTKILDRHGTLLYEASGEVKRTHIALANLPKYLRDATVAIEDKNFYQHHGFDPIAIVRAAIANYTHKQIKQGASTLTQQLARTILLNRDPSYVRKIKELVLAIKIEYRFDKDEILELYLNNIPYGSTAYGVEAASRLYFGKSAANLTIKEAAYIAALPKAPTIYSPYGPNVDQLHERANMVVEKMREQNYISEKESREALSSPNPSFNNISDPIKAPHFAFYVLDILAREYGEEKVRYGGLKVYTTLDLDKQQLAERIVADRAKINEKKHHATNAALVALDPANGDVLAMVGSRDYFKTKDGNVNVTLRPRQPGSSFKPYVYAAALERNFSPSTVIVDAPTNFAAYNNGVSYVPRNYSGRNYGRVTVRQALSGSLNVPAVKVLVAIGIKTAIDTAEKLGLSTLKDRKRFGPALVLGGAEVKLLEHTAGLGSFGNQGVYQAPSPILKIEEPSGRIIFKKKPPKGKQAVNPQAAYLISNILSDNEARKFIFGARNKLAIPGRQVAVKTGTTQDYRDAWTVGFTPDLAVGVWVGNNDNSPMGQKADGSVVAAPIWREFISQVLSVRPKKDFKRPKEIAEFRADRNTGRPLPKEARIGKLELFASYNIPKNNTPDPKAASKKPKKQPKPAVKQLSAAASTEPKP